MSCTNQEYKYQAKPRNQNGRQFNSGPRDWNNLRKGEKTSPPGFNPGAVAWSPKPSVQITNEIVSDSTLPTSHHVKLGAFPSNGKLFDFVTATELSNFDEALTDEIMSLNEDIPLKEKWLFWLESTNPPPLPAEPTREDYLNTLKLSRVYQNLLAIRDFAFQACENPSNAKICLFKQGLKPVWEDRGNYNGGRFFIACSTKRAAINTFLMLILKQLTGQLLVATEFNGLVLRIQPGRYSVELWNRNASEKDAVKMARKAMKKLFKKNVMYHVHRTTIKIVKYGLDTVMSEIERAEAEKKAEKEKKQIELVVTEKPQQKEETTLLEEVNMALVKVALADAWKQQNSEAQPPLN